ncbi:MAG: efflux RND transporter periplasmic adaptor subunit [Deferrisomatales bacterium]
MPSVRLLVLALCAGSLLILHGCGNTADPANASAKAPRTGNARLVVTAPAVEGDIERTLELTGEVVATNTVTIASLVDGPLACCAWREGDRVKEGQRLFEVDRPVYREELRSAEAALAVARARLADLMAGARPEEIAQAREKVRQLEDCAAFARADLERTAHLVESGSLKGEDAEKAKVAASRCRADLAAAREHLAMLQAGPTRTAVALQEAMVEEAASRVDLARARLAEGVIHAPFAGVVTRVYARPGDLASAKMRLLALLDPASLVVRCAVPERESARVRPGTPARLGFDARAGAPVEGVVGRVFPELDPKTRTRTVEIPLPEGLGVTAGMFARATLTLERATATVVIPEGALVTTPQGKNAVFVVADGVARRRPVTIGIVDRGRVQVAAGLAHGEAVVVEGHENLKDDAAVRTSGAPAAGGEGKAR